MLVEHILKLAEVLFKKKFRGLASAPGRLCNACFSGRPFPVNFFNAAFHFNYSEESEQVDSVAVNFYDQSVRFPCCCGKLFECTSIYPKSDYF